jgi:hypothetical protein
VGAVTQAEALARLILTKNEAFQALENADRYLDKRRSAHRQGKAGPVPEAWLARRAELAAEYDRALANVSDRLCAFLHKREGQ